MVCFIEFHNDSSEGDNIISVVKSGNDAVYAENVKVADIAFEYADTEAIPLDDEINKRLLSKIDLRVIPWLCGLSLQCLSNTLVPGVFKVSRVGQDQNAAQ